MIWWFFAGVVAGVVLTLAGLAALYMKEVLRGPKF